MTDGTATLAAGALTGATNVDGSGDLTMGTVTMIGFSVDADGDVVSKSLNNYEWWHYQCGCNFWCNDCECLRSYYGRLFDRRYGDIDCWCFIWCN